VIGIVVVSHSRALADAAVGLAREMVDAETGPRVVVAAGLDATTFGTDATAVSAAIEEVDSPDGVLVLLDLGSAVLSAEMALEFVDPDLAGRVRLSSAPLVEGLVAAVVLASTGADLDAVVAEAEQGLVAKQAHLGDASPDASADVTGGAPGEQGDKGGPAASADVTVDNPHGLHARPAAKVVALLRGFDATITLTNLDTGKGPVNAGSLSAVATLDARQGHHVRVTASGPQADEAVAAFGELAARAFDDPPTPTVISGAPAHARSGSGLDLALGPALVRRSTVDTSTYEPGDVATETTRSRDAVATVQARLEELERSTTKSAGEDAGAIFVAQRAFLDDPDVTGLVDQDLASGRSAVDAWGARLDAVAAGFESLADAYQRERAADVRSVQGAVLRALTGEAEPEDGPDAASDPVVLVVDELDAATAASIDVDRVAGIAVIARGDTGHGVIIAASRGIPLVTGIGDVGAAVRNGQVVAFSRGEFAAHPSDDEIRGWPERVAERQRERVELVEAARGPAVTTDGVTVPVLANVASVADAESAAANGADGSGLVRTEVLFGEQTTAPSVEEQTRAILALAEAMGGKRLTIRTWDIGGDKPLPFLPMAPEANPFLGVRGVRAFASDASNGGGLLHDQLAAICRAARETSLRVMFPMVTEAAEVSRALAVLDHAAGSEGRPSGLEVGIMIEVPAAAMAVDVLAAGLDFVSIGTNDLTQYATATDRGNDAVADLADPYNPGVIRLIDQVCRHRPEGLEVAVCGDLASRPDWTALLIGLGVDELSCTPPRVPEVKAVVRRTSRADARGMAQQVLQSVDLDETRQLMSG
jgi:phosphocarrier protein FPr